MRKPGWFSIQEDESGRLYVVPEDLHEQFAKWSEAIAAGVETNIDASQFIRVEGDDPGLIVFPMWEPR